MKLALSFLAMAVNAGPNCDVTESDSCPCAAISWKKAKMSNKSASKIQKQGQRSVEMRVAISNNIIDKDANNNPDAYQADWTFRDPTYGKNGGNAGVLTGSAGGVSSPKRYNPNFHIFLQWNRSKCGVAFLQAIDDGTVFFDAQDQYDVYKTSDLKKYYNSANSNKNLWTSIIQFRTENPEEDGHTLNSKAAVDDGNWKKDLLYLWMYGIDQVAFKNDDMETCLHSAYIAVLEIGENGVTADGDYTQCVAESMDIW